LFDWKLEDLTKASDGGILRQTLKVGGGYSSPNEEALVEGILPQLFNEKFNNNCLFLPSSL
jgi:hypothetical protein